VKFLLDHDVPDDIAFSLEALGHTVVKLREVLSVTTPDDEVLRHASPHYWHFRAVSVKVAYVAQAAH
jgi:hypothetical protein